MMRLLRFSAAPGVAFAIALLLAPSPTQAQSRGIDVVLDSALLAGYEWRNIGPDRGGRSIAVSGVRSSWATMRNKRSWALTRSISVSFSWRSTSS